MTSDDIPVHAYIQQKLLYLRNRYRKNNIEDYLQVGDCVIIEGS